MPLLVLLSSLLPGLVLVQAEPRVAADAAPAVEPDPSAGLSRADLEGRDRRLSFSAASADRARALLAAAPDDERARAIAVMALGASRSLADLPRIESLAADGQPFERRAAVLALGELAQDGRRPLERIARADVAGIEEALVLARIHALGRGSAECARLVETLGAQESETGLVARRFADYARGGDAPRRAFALEAYYELRWRAACAYGFVDGRRWERMVLEDLIDDEEFLDRVVLGASVELAPERVRDHLFEILLEGGRPGALRAVAAVMPVELARLIESGEWRPASLEEWRALLEEIGERHDERRAVPLLELAFAGSPELQPLAGLLLLRSGENLPWKWVGGQITTGPPELRAALVRAAGDRGDPERIPDLVGLITSRPELGLFGEGLVALARLDDKDSRAELERLVRSGPSEQRTQALRALAHVFHDRGMLVLGQVALAREDLEPELRFDLELGLALAGRSRGSEDLCARLATAPDLATKIQIVRALASRGGAEDLAKLRELFPVAVGSADWAAGADVLELDVELALALVRARDLSALAILRAALWSDSWNRSVLAGGLLERARGASGLADELDSPPPGASTQDLRRVGFSIGEWGGLSAVEALARRRGEGDPALQGALLGALAARAH